MKIGLDLDGTIYNTLDSIYEIDQHVRLAFGYGPISKKDYRRIFHTENWNRLCLDLGIRDEDIAPYREAAVRLFEKMEPPLLIPGGWEAVIKVEQRLGLENLYIVTNGSPGGIKKRFDRDGFSHLLGRVSHPYEGKAEALYDIAGRADGEFIYVGDLISDGKACGMARKMGAENIRFCAVTHGYAMNLPEMLEDFARECSYAFSIGSLSEIEKLWAGP